MATYDTNQFRSGLKVILDGNPCSIMENKFVNPGKGQAFNRVKIRNLLNGRVVEKTFKSGESVEAAEVVEQQLQYLYRDDDYWYFMDNNTYEQVSVSNVVIGETKYWLKAQDIYTVTLWSHQPISVAPPNFVVLTVAETDPGLKGNTAQGGSKLATLETGMVVRVPLFIEAGESIKVDTRSKQYVSRAKQ